MSYRQAPYARLSFADVNALLSVIASAQLLGFR
jgi:hypothetical protein